jgi:hypothetical protein
MSIIEEAKRQQALAEAARKRNLPEWQHEMAQAVDDATIKSLVSDFRRGPPGPSSIVKTDPKVEIEARRTSTSEPRPLVTPHVDYVDRVAAGFAARDRAKLVKELRGEQDDDGPDAA